jgi:hypothetical protein
MARVSKAGSGEIGHVVIRGPCEVGLTLSQAELEALIAHLCACSSRRVHIQRIEKSAHTLRPKTARRVVPAGRAGRRRQRVRRNEARLSSTPRAAPLIP